MKFENGIAEGLLMTALCAIAGAMGYLTAQKVEEISNLSKKAVDR